MPPKLNPASDRVEACRLAALELKAVIPSGYRNGVQAELVGLVLEPGDMLELPKWQMITLTDEI